MKFKVLWKYVCTIRYIQAGSVSRISSDVWCPDILGPAGSLIVNLIVMVSEKIHKKWIRQQNEWEIPVLDSGNAVHLRSVAHYLLLTQFIPKSPGRAQAQAQQRRRTWHSGPGPVVSIKRVQFVRARRGRAGSLFISGVNTVDCVNIKLIRGYLPGLLCCNVKYNLQRLPEYCCCNIYVSCSSTNVNRIAELKL